MKNRRKFAAAGIAVISAMLAVSGCSQGKDTTKGEKKSGPVTINYYGRPDDNDVESTIIKAFEEKNPDIKINYVELPDSSNDRLKTINTVLQAGDSSIDVFAGDVVWPPIFASAGWVIPLDEYLEPGETNVYLPGPLSAFQIQGKTYGLPFMADAGALYYRKDLLDKYGKTVPETWEELVETAEEIMEKEGNPDLNGFVSYWKQNESLTSSMLEIYWEKGGEIVDEAGKSVIEEAMLRDTLTQMKAMMDDKVTADGIETFGTKEARDVVIAGNAIFVRDWLSGYAPFNDPESSKVAGTMEIAPLPSYGCLGGWGVMVSSYSKNKPEAVEFAKFRANYESQLIASDLVNITPTLKAAYEDSALIAAKPQLPKFLPVLEASKPRPLTPFYAEISGAMQLEIHSVITGMTTPEVSAKNIVEKVNQILN